MVRRYPWRDAAAGISISVRVPYKTIRASVRGIFPGACHTSRPVGHELGRAGCLSSCRPSGRDEAHTPACRPARRPLDRPSDRQAGILHLVMAQELATSHVHRRTAPVSPSFGTPARESGPAPIIGSPFGRRLEPSERAASSVRARKLRFSQPPEGIGSLISCRQFPETPRITINASYYLKQVPPRLDLIQ